MSSSSSRRGCTAAKPAGVACVMRVVVTSPTFLPACLTIWAIGVRRVPSGSTLICPLKMRLPLPHELEADAESVTSELSDAISKKPSVASGLWSS
jgi:hypothetical protein